MRPYLPGQIRQSHVPAFDILEGRLLLSILDLDAVVADGSSGEPVFAGPSWVSELDPGFQAAIEEGLLIPSEDQVGLLLAAPGVEYGQVSILITDNANAADTTNTDNLWNGGGLGLNLTGLGLDVGVWDAYHVLASHVEFMTGALSRVTFGDVQPLSRDHATHVAGTIGADGDDPDARGMANQVDIVSYDWADDLAELRNAAGGLAASNHSYGTACGWSVAQFAFTWGTRWADIWYGNRTTGTEDVNFGKYNQRTHDLDDVLYDNPGLLSVWAAGNDRDDLFTNWHQNHYGGASLYVTWLGADSGTIVPPYVYTGAGYYAVFNTGATVAPGPDAGQTGFDTLPPEANAKNTVVVGAIQDIVNDPYGTGDVAMLPFSAWGPTDDGRIGPDLVANGYRLHSTIATSNTAYDGDPGQGDPTDWSGTSMAAPNVTGSAVLLIEHYGNLLGTQPLSATTKGLLLHTAFDAGRTGPDYEYGWGLLDAAAAATFLTNAAGGNPSCWVSQNTYSGAGYSWTLISDGTEDLKATIVWTDPAGPAQNNQLDDTTSVLVNDLDLWITDPYGNVLRPWLLDPAQPDLAAGTGINHRDNVEQVLIDAPLAGTYTIHVGGTLGVGYSQQAYSLLVSGAVDAIEGTEGNDTFDLVRNAGNPNLAELTVNQAKTYLVDLSGLSSALEVNGLAGNDAFTVDFANGSPVPALGLAYGGGDGSDILGINGSTGGDCVELQVGQVTVNAGPAISHEGVESMTIALGDGDDMLVVNLANGNPVPAGGVAFHGEDGEEDELQIVGTAAAETVTQKLGQVQIGTGPLINYTTDVERVWVVLGAGNDTLTLDYSSDVGIPTGGIMFEAGGGYDTEWIYLPDNKKLTLSAGGEPGVGGTIAWDSDLEKMCVVCAAEGPLGDTLAVDYADGDPLPSDGVAFYGGTGNDRVKIMGSETEDDTVVLTSGQVQMNSYPAVTYEDVERIWAALRAGTNNVEVNGDVGQVELTLSGEEGGGLCTLTAADPVYTDEVDLVLCYSAIAEFDSSLSLASLDLQADTQATLTSGDAKVISTKALSIEENYAGTPLARLDLTDNDLILDYDGGTAGVPSPELDAIRGWIIAGYNGGDWDGNGIMSSTAATDPVLYAIGYAQNDMLFYPYGTFDNTSVDGSTILVKFTYGGDANLDGMVSDPDVAIIGLYYDHGASNTHYWTQGDIYLYDGYCDDNDVALIGLTYGYGIGDPL
jgi:hypothetical protein